MNSREKALDGALRSVAQRCYGTTTALKEFAKTGEAELPPSQEAVQELEFSIGLLNREIYALAELQGSFIANSDVGAVPLRAGMKEAM